MLKYLFIISIIFVISYLIIYQHKEKNRNNYRKKICILNESKKLIYDQEFLNIPKYYINLERSKDRKNKFLDQIKYYKINNCHRVEAFDIKKIKQYNYHNEYNNILDGSNTELVVTMSHIKAIMTAYENKDDYALIMEDDINFITVPLWETKLKDLLNNLHKDCDFLLLANNIFEEGEIKIKKAEKSYGIAVGVCYIITKQGMKKVKENFTIDNKIVFLKDKNLGEQPFVFDRGFLNFFNLYYTSQSLFIADDFHQDSLIRKNIFGVESKISEKVINHYSNLVS